MKQKNFSPDQLLFTRRAVRRLIFSQGLTWGELKPQELVSPEVMHPVTTREGNPPEIQVKNGILQIRCQSGSPVRVSVPVSSVNPFATYDIALSPETAAETVAFEFEQADGTAGIRVIWHRGTGAVSGEARQGGYVSHSEICPGDAGGLPEILRVQLMGTGLSVYREDAGVTTFLGFMDFGIVLDLRRQAVVRTLKFSVGLTLRPAGHAGIRSARAWLSCGMGQADIRPVTDREGYPLMEDNRLWLLMTCRGYGLPHPVQGCFSMNPTVTDLRFEGMIVFDRGDGMLRNEVATHLFFDRETGLWQGWTCGFSDAWPAGQEATGIWCVSSPGDPRRGFSVMQARPMETGSHSEDPCGFYDAGAGKWRMVVSRFTSSRLGIRAVMTESDHWDGPYHDISGPVPFNSTGTQIQRVGGSLRVLSAGSDQKLRCYSYPDMQYQCDIRVDLPPWGAASTAPEGIRGRVWPDIVPMPEGCAMDYIALMMDRENFPGIQDANWTYGALHLYDAWCPEI